MSKLSFVGERTKKIFKWIRFQKMSDWVESNVVLNKGAIRGKFQVRTAPHLYEVMNILDKKHINVVTLKVASQTQKTTIGISFLLKQIDCDYHDVGIMFPRASDMKKMINFKITPAIDGCKSVKLKMEDYRQDEKERKHSHYYKTAQNMFAILSANETKSITLKCMVFDEASEFPAGVISEALERLKEYGLDSKALITSTQIHEDDEVNHFFNISEVKMQYQLYCRHCSDHFYPSPEHLVFPTIAEYKEKFGRDENERISYNEIMSDYKPYASRKAHLICPNCSHEITDKERRDDILDGKCKWFQVEAVQKDENDEIIWQKVKKEKEYYESIGLDANTIIAPRVPLQKIAEKEIECKYAEPHKRGTLYDKFYVGYWNRIYKPKNSSKATKSDILLLANGLGYRELTAEQHQDTPNRDFIGVPHNDTNAIHIGVDLQKDGLYYAVLGFRMAEDMTVDIIEYGKLYHNGFKDDTRQLKYIMEHSFETPNGDMIGVESTGIDIRGFKLNDDVKGGEKSRSQDIVDFIFDYSEQLRDYGVVNWDKIVHPMMGNKDLKGNDKELSARYEVTGYLTRPRKRTKEVDGVEETTILNDIVFSNRATKDRLFKMIERGIEMAKASDGDKEYKYDRNLLYIPDYALDDFDRRQLLPHAERMNKHSLENHLTSERLSYKLDKNGKPTDVLLYQKVYEGVRNDWLDCCCMAITQSLLHKTYNTPKPEIEEVSIDVVNPMDRFKNSIGR